nr:Intraflagellar transport protein 57 [Polyrhizophydium stewartii]
MSANRESVSSNEGIARSGSRGSVAVAGSAAGSAPGGVGAPAGQTQVAASIDDILDKLKCLGYAKQFCKPNNIRPFHRFYFAAPGPNPNEQFFHFALLVSWLMKLSRHAFEPPGQFDDPNAVSANIAAELKKIGVPFEFAPVKLRQAYGDAVLYVLQVLVDMAMAEARFTFQKPVHKIDEQVDCHEAEVDANAEVTADSIEDSTPDPEDEEEMFLDSIQSSKKPEEANPIKPKTDPSEWKLEVERVTPMLKVQIPNDNKDWRIHFDQIDHHQKTINACMAETQSQLAKLHTEIEKTLEKIASREKYINTQFEPQARLQGRAAPDGGQAESGADASIGCSQIEQYRTLQDQSSDLKQKHSVASTNVTELTNELSRISEELDSVKSRMDDLGNGMTDSKPLVAIKQGLARLKAEIKQMDLRIGVIEHTLLHAKLKSKGPISMDPRFSVQVLSFYRMF